MFSGSTKAFHKKKKGQEITYYFWKLGKDQERLRQNWVNCIGL